MTRKLNVPPRAGEDLCPCCKKPLAYASGIGPYCATKDCPVIDNSDVWVPEMDDSKAIETFRETSFLHQGVRKP